MEKYSYDYLLLICSRTFFLERVDLIIFPQILNVGLPLKSCELELSR